jgi:hypothetical protein
MHLPSAGMIRFRFNGSAFLHLSPFRHPEVIGNIAPQLPDARGVNRRALNSARNLLQANV